MASNGRAARRHPERHTTDKGAVVFATLSPSGVSAEFAHAAQTLMMRDGAEPDWKRMFIRPGNGNIWLQSGPRIAEARTQIVKQFLTAEGLKDAEWILLVDSDMTFTFEDVQLLYEAANKVERPIVGGLCFGGFGPSFMFPTIHVLERTKDGVDVDRVWDYPRDQLVKCDGTGAAFLLVHRDVFTKMASAHPGGFGTLPDGTINPYPWFAEGHMDSKGRPMGEDIVFCLRANALELPIFVHTGVKIGHHKSVVLTEELYDSVRATSSHTPARATP